MAAALLSAGAALIIIPSHDTTSDSLLANAAGMAVSARHGGLTNIRRHAPGAKRVRVSVASARLGAAPALAVTVANDAGSPHSGGRPLDAPGRNGGFGLRALRERVEALGGTLHAGPDDTGGWQLSALPPVRDRARPTQGV